MAMESICHELKV